ncbi:hypothetical protein SD70_04370 [Gordoniibacillus kamchatkensis]|uniref:Uncharacterized protein n=1 Tax=Gordoniibacillus kamchatkensis TaxID=1590651 RepID=A0ABR5ALL8_9BACL|nr:hypothetical protein [Paenibacillus sp. VKM B-2647]KIL41856.1 hypothetical protein SD70_04370 [Paenibacillus sp. VKM B-2647]
MAAALVLALAPAAALKADAAAIVPPVPVVQDGTVQQQTDDGTLEQQALRGGAYRSPGGTFSGGARPGGGTYRTGPRTPSPDVTRPPRTTTPGGGAGYVPGRTGTFLGGMAAGALLGHLLNPFAGFGWGGYGGYGGGFGMSLLSLLIWAGLLYAAYRVIRRLFGGGGPRGGGWPR